MDTHDCYRHIRDIFLKNRLIRFLDKRLVKLRLNSNRFFLSMGWKEAVVGNFGKYVSQYIGNRYANKMGFGISFEVRLFDTFLG